MTKEKTEKNDSVKAENDKKEVKKETKEKVKKAEKTVKSQEAPKKAARSKKYQEKVEKVNKKKEYGLVDAIELAKETSYSKFDGSLELHFNLLTKKNQQPIRKLIELPNGTGKKMNIVVLDEAKIEDIAKTKKVNFDIALVTPQLMPKVGKIAKILGVKGKMPNPKSGTITTDPEKTKKEFESGRIELKEDKDAQIHQTVGKVSWDVEKLIENAKKVFAEIPRNRIKSLHISATMGPGIKVRV